jgi:hypothetical protein
MMKTSLRVISFLTIGLTAYIGAAQGALPPTPPAEPWFSVTISTPEATVSVGSGAKLKIVFANNTEKELHSPYGGPGRGGPVFDIEIRDTKGNPVSETPYGLKMHGKDPHPFSGSVFRATSRPGETIEEEVALSKEYDLSKPGKYTVHVREKHPVFQAVKSNMITIIVKP